MVINMRKTKIVCTLGPATDNPQVLKALMLSGMNVARMNFSHGTHDEHKIRMDVFKKMRDQLSLPIALMLDTKGPEIRIKTFENDKIELNAGDTFTLTTDDVLGTEKIVSVTYKNLPMELSKDNIILIDDGLIELLVQQIKGANIVCKVQNGGSLSNNKSINLPGISISMPYMSEKDKSDILFGIENEFDIIAASFVRSALDVLEIKKLLASNNGSHIKIISKIENMEGVKNSEEIIKASDGLMVARGDMGVEIPLEDLPIVQKQLIKNCYKAGKVVITATQMLDSMIRNPRPTRAETTDVANAIYDGTSAIMLSGETAIGKYPVEAFNTMAKIAKRTENAIDYKKRFNNLAIGFEPNITNAISHATCMTAHDLDVAAIVTVSSSGHTARMVSKFRPKTPILCATPSKLVYRQLAIVWGVLPMLSEEVKTTDELFEHAVEKAQKTGMINQGDLIVITGGSPVGVSGTTNLLKVHLVGDVLVRGTGTSSVDVIGTVSVAKSEQDISRTFQEGNILVIKQTSNDMLSVLKNAKGIIVEEEGLGCHAAIVGMALDIPVITGAKGATKILKSGTTITMDCTRGLVYNGATKVLK